MAADGRRVPILEERPELWPWLVPVAEAFFCLHQSRGYAAGMNGAAPLPFSLTDIVTYWRAFQPGFALREFIQLVQAADRAYLKAPKPKPPTPPPPKPAPKLWVPGRR